MSSDPNSSTQFLPCDFGSQSGRSPYLSKKHQTFLQLLSKAASRALFCSPTLPNLTPCNYRGLRTTQCLRLQISVRTSTEAAILATIFAPHQSFQRLGEATSGVEIVSPVHETVSPR